MSTHFLHLIMMNNARPSCITAAAGTRISQDFSTMFESLCSHLVWGLQLTFNPPVTSPGHALAHCPVFPTAAFLLKPGPCLSSNVADPPLSAAKGLWLGQPLPNQLSDLTLANPAAIKIFLSGINLATGQYTIVILTRTPFFFDSHVLKRVTSVHSEPESNSNNF